MSWDRLCRPRSRHQILFIFGWRVMYILSPDPHCLQKDSWKMTSVERPKVFGAGLIALDLVISSDPQSPARSWAGGTCGNVLSILAYLGWEAYPIARLNGDPASIRVLADMQ